MRLLLVQLLHIAEKAVLVMLHDTPKFVTRFFMTELSFFYFAGPRIDAFIAGSYQLSFRSLPISEYIISFIPEII